jgi:hypothetical protein
VSSSAQVRSHVRNSIGVGTLAALVLALGVISASAASPVKITNCFKASSRPKQLILTCGDANTALSKLSWSSFGGASASATGTFEMNTCNPNCASGKFVKYPVKVKASATRTCKGGLRVYNKLTLQFTARKPPSSGSLKNWTLGCPIST